MINLDKAKGIANSVPVVVDFFRPLYRKTIKAFIEKKRNKTFLLNGMSVLKEFHDVLTDHGLYYTLAFGTLLGCVREKGFIKHDDDIDVHMWSEDYSDSLRQLLESHGFKLTHRFVVDDALCGLEETYEKSGVAVDIFFIYKSSDDRYYCCDFLQPQGCISYSEGMKKFGGVVVRRLFLPFKKSRELAPFGDLNLFIPINAHDLLKARYGDTYMIPNPQWGIKSYNNNIVIWEGKKGIFQHFD